MSQTPEKIPLLERIISRRQEINLEKENARKAKETRREERIQKREARLKDSTLKTTYKMAAYRRSSSLSKWDELLALRDKLKLDNTADLEKDEANDDTGSQAHSKAGGDASTSRSEDSRDRDKNSDSSNNSTWGTSEGNRTFKMAGIAEQIMIARNIDPKKWESMSKPQKLRIIAAERKREAEEVNNQQRDMSELKRRLHKKKNAKRVFNLADMIKVQRQMDNHAEVVQPTNVGLDSGYTSPSTGSPLGNSEPLVAEAAKSEEVKRTLHQRNSHGATVKTLSFEETQRDRHQARLRDVDVPSGDTRKVRQEVTEERTVASKWQRQVVIKEGTGTEESAGASKGNRNEIVVKADVIVSAIGPSGNTVVRSQQQQQRSEKVATNSLHDRSEKTTFSSEKNQSDKKVVVKTDTNSSVVENNVHSADTSKSVIANTNNEIIVDSKVVKDNKTVGKSEASKKARQTVEDGEKTADSKSCEKVEKTAENISGEKVEKSTSKLVGSVVKKGSKMADKEEGEKGPQEKREKEEPEKISEKKEEEKPKTPEKEEEKDEEEKEPEKGRTPSPEQEKDATLEPENGSEPKKSPTPEAKNDAETAPSPEPKQSSPEPEKDNELPSEGEQETEPTEEAPVVEPEPHERAATPESGGDEDSSEDDEEAEAQAKKERQDKIDSTLSALDALIDNQLNSVLGRPQKSGNGPGIPQEKLNELLNGEFSQALDRYLQGNSDGTDLMDKCLEVLG